MKTVRLIFFVMALSLSACGRDSSHENTNSVYNPEAQSGIFGGKRVQSGSPYGKWLVAVMDRLSCSGSIVANNLVLSAAHCVNGKRERNGYIYFGVDTANPVATRRITGVLFAPYWADLALIRFEGSLPGGFEPIPLLPASLRKDLRAGIPIITMGYGQTDYERGEGRTSELHYVLNEIYGFSWWWDLIRVDQTQKGACFGDSGGPSFVSINNRKYQFCVTSTILSHTDCRKGLRCVDVTRYENWLNEAAKELTGRPLH